MQSIMWLLVLLIALFFSGMLLLSNLNLNYSQQALSELRRDQIRDVFFASLTRIDARQQALERQTSALSLMGETFYRLASQSPQSDATRQQLQAQLDQALRHHLKNSDGASGAGIWFEPGILAPAGDSYASYFVQDKPGGGIQGVKRGRTTPHFRQAPWFNLIFGEHWQDDHPPAERVYWSPVYFDFTNARAVLTLARPMFSADHRLIGVVTTDWAAARIIDLVSRVTVTDNSFTFLNDRNNRNLSSLAQGKDTVLEQRLIDAILGQHLSATTPGQSDRKLSATSRDQRLQTRSITVGDRVYELYYASTPAGMIYGAGVPRDEIDSVLLPMQKSNTRILVITGSVLLLLSLYLLYRILLLMRELRASYTDELTGLPNRARLLKDLETRGDACLMLINLDRFKELNSLFGDDCGDQVLIAVAGHMRRFSKDHSQVFRSQVYRLPGAEFALLGPRIDASEIHDYAGDLSEFLRHQHIDWQQQSLSVDASAGVACRDHNQGKAAAGQLLSRATIALLRAREQLRNYVIYDSGEQVEKDYQHNLYWARRLKDALLNDHILPHFQPIFDNQHQRISKYECLVRMGDDSDDVVSAGHFLGIARKLRLGRQVTCIMIDKSFEMFAGQPYEFSINLSYADLIETDVLDRILRHLRERDIGQRVIFEILESDGIENYNQVLHFIEQVKPFGCQIAIDDFGTGYANFEHLLRLNVDIIKIDGGLIRNLDTDATALAIVRGIVQFARSLNIQTVAEFVHNEAVHARVIELGIDFSQGEYFRMPGATLVADSSPRLVTRHLPRKETHQSR